MLRKRHAGKAEAENRVAPSSGPKGNGLGSYEWARRTGGRLSGQDRLRLLGQGLAFQLRELPLQLGRPLGLRPRSLASFDLAELRIPDSAAAKQAEELCGELRPEMLINHSYRTYAWAAVIAAHRHLSYDEEVVYVSSLLHDLGLSELHRNDGGRCFTLVGAEAAEQITLSGGWSERRAELAADAITLHMNLGVPKDAPEAWLTAFGTQFDAVGANYSRMAAATRQAVLERYPRGPVQRGMVSLFDWQASRNPGTRSHFYARYMSLRWRLRHTPFAS